MTPETKTELEATLATKQKLADELWEELKKVETEIKPHIDRYEDARKQWHSAHTGANALNDLLKTL